MAEPILSPERFSFQEKSLIGLSCFLLFIWTVPGTIALRLAVTVALLGLSLSSAIKAWGWPIIGRSFAVHRNIWLIYLSLTLWIIIEGSIFGIHKEVVFKDIWGQWVRSGICGLIGYMAAVVVTRRKPDSGGPLLAGMMALTLAFQVGLHDIDTIWRWISEGKLPFQETRLAKNRTGISFVTNLLMALVAAELLARVLFKKRYVAVHTGWLVFVGAMCFFATYVLGTRFGTLGFIALLISSATVALFAKRQSISPATFVLVSTIVVGLIASFAWASIQSDPRWQTFSETVTFAMDTESHAAWRDKSLPMPTLNSGLPAEESAYMRVSWAKEAIGAIMRDPLGIGFSRSAFGHAMQKIYPDYASDLHCHSGILNFTVGAGLPALILWLLFICSLIVTGWRAFFERQNPSGLLLLLLVSGFSIRSVVDGNMQDHMLEQFMFLSMMFLVLASRNEKETVET